MGSTSRDTAGGRDVRVRSRFLDEPHRYNTTHSKWRGVLLASAMAASAVLAPSVMAQGDTTAAVVSATREYRIAAGSLADALHQFSEQSGLQVFFESDLVRGKTAPAINSRLEVQQALTQLLEGSGLVWQYVNDNTLVLRRANAGGQDADAGVLAGVDIAQNGAVASMDAAQPLNPDTDAEPGTATGPTTASVETARRGGIEEIIVTGQKRAERLQDVPIAISAFTMEQMDNQKIEGGFDLLKAVPNVTFSKTNFSGYNFQIRGVGTQAISATTDPGVAVSFNNTTLIVNRLFEQEYLDIERVEVLRGPQGTLFGRNANAGVINVIPSKPEFGVHTGEVRLETGNYSAQRIRGHYNLPLNDDSLAVRLAYASTVRDGYVTNEFDGKPIDGRDLSTSRISLGWKPTDSFDVNLSWERFKEDDDRLRSAKNLCHRDNGPDRIANLDVDSRPPLLAQSIRRSVHQGCLPGSLYSAGAFDTPNGDAAPFITVGRVNNEPFVFVIPFGSFTGGFDSPPLLTNVDVFSSARQSTDLRTVYSPIEPQYRATADLYDLTLGLQWTDALRLTSYTVYTQDELYSTQDFTRYAASPGLFSDVGGAGVLPQYANFAPGGVFCDPQLGCSSAFLAQDISQSNSTQFNQQFELVSDFDGMWNFSLGVNYTRFKTTADYFFFSNVLTALAQVPPFNGPQHRCTTTGGLGCVSVQQDDLAATAANPYGHNFFLSRNPYELNSGGVFGESYWQLTPSLKATLGLRMTWDRKTFTPTPSQTLLADYREAGVNVFGPSIDDPLAGPQDCIRLVLLCGTLGNAPGGIGYPTSPDIVQTWREPTGRFVIDWMPDLPFTDETLVYASYARGYKGGGANPPGIAPPAGIFIGAAQGAVSPKTFEAEYVNAFEVGTKNSFLSGGLTVNATAFYYDYENYQVSKIVDRSASNENFDAKIFGAELEVVMAPTPNWLSNAAIGYLHTRIADGEQSIDLMDRTQGGNQFYITEMLNPAWDPDVEQIAREDYVAGLTAPAGQANLAFDNWVVVKPSAAQASNCIAPAELVAQQATAGSSPVNILFRMNSFCPAGTLVGDNLSPEGYQSSYAPNGSAGFFADLSGHELPNAPRFTVSLGTQYTFQLPAAWDLTGRVDWYWQDQSYARVYNTEYDRLRDWSSTNFSLWAEKASWDLKIELYVKNAFNDTPITGSFLNSDDTGLTTNIFTLDPRLIGVSILKRF